MFIYHYIFYTNFLTTTLLADLASSPVHYWLFSRTLIQIFLCSALWAYSVILTTVYVILVIIALMHNFFLKYFSTNFSRSPLKHVTFLSVKVLSVVFHFYREKSTELQIAELLMMILFNRTIFPSDQTPEEILTQSVYTSKS